MFASVQIVGSAQDSGIGELRRTRGRGLGVKGPQVQILSSRRETAGQRPFRTKSEAAPLLPCSNGVATAHVLTSPLLLRAVGRRIAPSVETAARRYAVAPRHEHVRCKSSATACAD